MAIFEQEGVHVISLGSLGMGVQPHVSHPAYPTVRVDEQGVAFDGKLVLARADIASVVMELGPRTRVLMRTVAGVAAREKGRIQRRAIFGWACTFTDPAQARSLLLALGRDPERTVSEVELEPSLLRAGFDELPIWRVLVATAISLVAMTVLLPFLTRPHGGLRVFAGLLDSRLELGTDGVRIRGRLANAFVRYRDILSVSTRDDTVVLQLADGRTSVLKPAISARVPDVVRHIERAIRASGAGSPDDIVDRLREVRGTRPEQVLGLRELGAEADASYRTGAVPRERLWSLVEDPDAEHVARARAAIALSGALAAPDRERLRVAADATVSPKLRVALDAAAGDDDARLAEQLDELPEAAEGEHAEARTNR